MAHSKVTKSPEKQPELIKVKDDRSSSFMSVDATINISNLKTVDDETFNNGFKTMSDETFLELIPVNSFFH